MIVSDFELRRWATGILKFPPPPTTTQKPRREWHHCKITSRYRFAFHELVQTSVGFCVIKNSSRTPKSTIIAISNFLLSTRFSMLICNLRFSISAWLCGCFVVCIQTARRAPEARSPLPKRRARMNYLYST